MHVTDSRARFVRGDAMRLPFPDGGRRWRAAAWSSASSLLLSRPLQGWPASCAPAARSPRTSGTTPREAWNSSATSGNRSLPGRGQSGPGRVPASGRPGGRGGRRDQHRHTLQEFRRLRGPVPGRARACPVVPASLSQKGGRSSVWWAPLRLRASRPLRGGGWQATAGRPRHRTRPHRCSAATGGSGLSATAGVCSCADSTEARPSTAPAAPGADPIRQQDRARGRKPARQAPTERATPRARQERLMVAEVAGRSRRVPAEPGRAPSSPVRRGASGGT